MIKIIFEKAVATHGYSTSISGDDIGSENIDTTTLPSPRR
jgi:hypothetical protein